MARRSYDQYCPIARALDLVGDRWTLLIARELLAGPRRYTDLHADLPGVSTDVLATRLKDLERDGLVVRRKLPPPGAATVYALTARGRELLPVLSALADFGAADLAERRPTDALRAHWLAIPLMERLRPVAEEYIGVVEVVLDEGTFHLVLDRGDWSYGDGPAERPDVRLEMDTALCLELVRQSATLDTCLSDTRTRITGTGPLADALRGLRSSEDVPAGT